jgi:tetratricopeptide (TPR) repeat protein
VAAAVALALLLAGCGRVDPDTAVAEAHDLSEQGKTGEARILLKNALGKVPDLPGARLELARIALREGDASAAWDELGALAGSAAAEPAAVALKVRVALETGRIDDAAALLQKQGATLAEPEGTLLRARVLRAQGKAAGAMTLLRGAQQAHPADAQLAHEAASTLAAMGNLTAAIAELDRHLAGDKSDADGLVLRARVRMAQRQGAEALKDLRAALEVAPRSWTGADRAAAELMVGDALLASGDKAGARAQVDKLHKDFPGVPGTEVLDAQLLQLEGNYPEAARRLEGLVEAMPGNPRLLGMLAEASARAGDVRRATELLEKVAPGLPPDAPERRTLATLWMQQGRADRALAALGGDAEVRLASGEGDPLLASVQQARSRATATVAELQRRVAKQPDDASLLAELALAQVTNGQNAAALTTLSRVPAGKETAQTTAARMTALLAAGNEIEANRLVDRLLDPDAAGDLPTLVAAADAAQRQSRAAISGRLLDRAAALDPRNLEVTLRQASLAFDQKRHDDAQRLLQGILAADPKQLRASIGLARVLEARGDLDGARKALQAAIAGDIRAQEAPLMLAGIELRAQRPAEAGKVLDAMAAARPDGSGANAAGLLLAQNGRQAEARARFMQAATQDAANASYWFNLGNAALALGDKDAAREAYQRSAQLQPAMLPAAAAAARLALEKRDFAAASRLATAATQADPRSAGAWLLRGHVALAAEEAATASDAYARATALRPNAAAAVGEFRARLKSRAPRPDAPLAAWVAREPADIAARQMLVEYYLGSGQADGARQQLEAILKASPNDVAALNNLAWLLRASDAARAEELARQAHAIAPDNGSVADTLGLILIGRGRHEEAVGLLETASKALRDDRAIQYHYALALQRAGRTGPAREALQRALDGGAPFAERAEAQRLKEELK